MVKPAAPWFRWGLVLWIASQLVDIAAIQAMYASVYVFPYVAAVPRLAAVVLLAVGVFRLVQHADRAAGVVARPGPESPGISEDERVRQAEARAQLAVTGGLPTPAE